ncbi:MAG: hypothetical protein BWY73_01151 [candidate division TA06 bacterium ADurb.Bin417]|uniref:Glycoside hydrolase family 42 N-terminal domain-containing protein n=1 Tax=candidate division TA06 bacterium ADurb.Bin417 TaxID=1852828 RepID=A0A1V5MDC0_UNCT6|nr:MAG: hypothetical protein BWY73_01151 [candidate division TA06 bacterium ADurb.Bin417]
MEKKLPWWKESGLTVAGGWHPITGRIRRHIPNENEEADYLWEYTEAHILRLKELGITLLVSQFDRGLGDTDQAEEQERARLQAELCHQHGLRHGVYLANTVYYESMLKDYPECEDWAVVTHDGRKVHYGGEQTWRWLACFNSPGWRERMRRQIERAVNYVKTDWLHFDNLEVWPEPESCHCRYCQEAFKKFLYRKYPDPASQKRRFGYPGFETFRAPNFYLRFTGPWDLDRVECPLMQEWILFRCWQVTDYFRDLAGYARSLNPAIGVDSNGQCIRGVNHAFTHGVDHGAQAAYADAVWDENPDYRSEEHPAAIYPSTVKFRGANFLRRLDKEVLGGYKDEETLAANLTFTGHPGINHAWGYAEPGRMPLNPAQPGVAELLEHQRRNRGLYANLRPAARIGLWRSHLSLAFVSTDTHLSAFVLEQTLFNHRIPFSIIFDQQLTPEGLKEFDLLILPDAEFISDAQVALLTGFVESGGRLLITEKSGRFTDGLRPPLQRLKPPDRGQPPGGDRPHRVTPPVHRAGVRGRKSPGRVRPRPGRLPAPARLPLPAPRLPEPLPRLLRRHRQPLLEGAAQPGRNPGRTRVALPGLPAAPGGRGPGTAPRLPGLAGRPAGRRPAALRNAGRPGRPAPGRPGRRGAAGWRIMAPGR